MLKLPRPRKLGPCFQTDGGGGGECGGSGSAPREQQRCGGRGYSMGVAQPKEDAADAEVFPDPQATEKHVQGGGGWGGGKHVAVMVACGGSVEDKALPRVDRLRGGCSSEDLNAPGESDCCVWGGQSVAGGGVPASMVLADSDGSSSGAKKTYTELLTALEATDNEQQGQSAVGKKNAAVEAAAAAAAASFPPPAAAAAFPPLPPACLPVAAAGSTRMESRKSSSRADSITDPPWGSGGAGSACTGPVSMTRWSWEPSTNLNPLLVTITVLIGISVPPLS
mmetsp:Transcript_32104/g.65388  ORF Transcript_32104/g.65388 Transcript_32104/m.65388 type:complete len:280 (+) Transcript_32104:471-1310(+)